MQEMHRHVLAVMGRVLFLGFSVQIALGLLWMIYNFELVLFLQLVVAVYASYRLFCAVANGREIYGIWAGLAMVTNPLVMLSHSIQATWIENISLLTSFLLLEIVYTIDLLQQDGNRLWKSYSKVLICWLLVSFCQESYFWFGAIPVLFSSVCVVVKIGLRGNRKPGILCLGMLLLSLLLSYFEDGVGFATFSRPNVREHSVYESVSFRMASRFSWPRLKQDYYAWPEEIRSYLTEGDLFRAELYAENMERILGRKLVEELGEEHAQKVFLEMATVGWERHKSLILHDIAWDVLGYSISPVVLQLQLNGKAYHSFSGRNYDSLRGKNPQLAVWYLDYGCWWFVAGCVLSTVLSLMGFWVYVATRKRRKPDSNKKNSIKKNFFVLSLCLMISVLMVTWYTMSGAGVMDYKKTTIVSVFWVLWMTVVTVNALQKGRQDERE